MPWATCIREDSMKQNRIMWEFSPLGWGSANEKWISGQNCNIHPKWSASQMYIIIKSWESEGKSNPKRGQNVKEGFQQFLQSSQSASVKISIPSHCFKTWMNIIWISYSSQTWMKLDCENCFKTWEWTKFEKLLEIRISVLIFYWVSAILWKLKFQTRNLQIYIFTRLKRFINKSHKTHTDVHSPWGLVVTSKIKRNNVSLW